MSSPDGAAIGPLKRTDNGPLFDEPWQVQVLALADTLSRSGVFTTTEWSETLGEELRRAERRSAPDNAATYYEAALKALERLLERSGLAAPEALAARRAAWVRAYLATPHGRPVELRDG